MAATKNNSWKVTALLIVLVHAMMAMMAHAGSTGSMRGTSSVKEVRAPTMRQGGVMRFHSPSLAASPFLFFNFGGGRAVCRLFFFFQPRARGTFLPLFLIAIGKRYSLPPLAVSECRLLYLWTS